MGGSVRVGYNGKTPPEAEWNIKFDIPAAQTVFASGVPLVVAPLDATATVKLDEAAAPQALRRLHAVDYQVQALYQLWDKPTPTLFDPVAVALVLQREVLHDGRPAARSGRQGIHPCRQGQANARVATAIKQRRVSQVVRRARRRRASRCCRSRRRTCRRWSSAAAFPNRVHCFRGLRNGHRETLVDERQGGDDERAAGQQARLPRRADAGLRRPPGRHEDDVHGRHLQSGARPADGQEPAAQLPLLAQGDRHAARADLQPDERLSPLPGADEAAAGELANRRRWT